MLHGVVRIGMMEQRDYAACCKTFPLPPIQECARGLIACFPDRPIRPHSCVTITTPTQANSFRNECQCLIAGARWLEWVQEVRSFTSVF